ncbi:MAG: hypothetical protein WCJ37_02200 [Syntrophus sp. (in: bacteria)]
MRSIKQWMSFSGYVRREVDVSPDLCFDKNVPPDKKQRFFPLFTAFVATVDRRDVGDLP